MDSWVMEILLLLCTLLCLLYWYLTNNASYFKSRGIPYLKHTLLVGHLDLYTKSQLDLSQTLYNSFPGERFFGFFDGKVPTLLVKDPQLLQRIVVKDFSHFQDRGFLVTDTDVLVSKNLFHMKGDTWRTLRQKLTPTFTSGKIKLMFNQFVICGDHMLENIEESSLSGKPLDAKQVCVDFATEVIASTAFGLDLSKKNPQTKEFVNKITTLFISGYCALIMKFMVLYTPKLVNLFRLSYMTPGTSEYFMNLTKATKEYRKNNNIKRNDYFEMLLSMQDAEESGKSGTEITDNEEDALINQMKYVPLTAHAHTGQKLLTDEVLTAQTLVFLMAGSDSVSGSLSFALYHIAKNQNIQQRLVEELDNALIKCGGWTYQAIKEMTYMDQVIQETMRMYPLVPMTFRQCTLPYHIPDSNIVLEKGTIVAIPVGGLHMDPKYYPCPNVFDPERFANNNHKPNPTYMPFGDGPRICIAIRFAVVELKVFLAKMLSQYSIDVDKKTLEPLTFDQKSFVPKPVGGIWVNFKKRQKLST